MNVLIHKRSKPGDGSLAFPALQCWNPVTRVATVAADFSGRRVSCRIKIDDLRKKFPLFTGEPMQSVTDHRPEIENAIRNLIEKNDFEDDGSIVINFKDL